MPACEQEGEAPPRAQVTPKNSAAGLAPAPLASKAPQHSQALQRLGHALLMGPSPTVTQAQALPSTRLLPGARQGLGGGEKLVKRREAALCGQSKSAVRNTASAAGDTLGFRTPATEMVTVLTIPLLMCASDHHAGHLQYTCLLKNNIKQN